MNPDHLKRWMDRNNKSVTWVAAQANISTKTVERFLYENKEHRPAILDAIRRVMATPIPKEETKESY